MRNILAAIIILVFLVLFYGCAGKFKVGEKHGKAAASVNFPIGN
jgi:uncharacterized membrane protein